MFFDSSEEIKNLAKSSGFSIYVSNDPEKLFENLPLKNFLSLKPDEKSDKISIDSVRDFIALTGNRTVTDMFFVILYPEKMNQEASNAFLKTLEEPKENYHFIFLTKNPSELLPTILSRARIFFLREKNSLESPVNFDEKTKDFAKRLMTLRERDLPDFAKEIADKKDRVLAENIVAAAIEMSYKTYFKTGNQSFLKKLPKYLELYENLKKNGHIKLHFLADLL